MKGLYKKEAFFMKKIFIVFLFIAAFIFCATAQDKVPLTFLYYIDATQAGYDIDVAVWQKFRDENPDIDLQMEILFNEPFHQKVSAYIASGQLPDVMFMWPSGRSTELHAKKLVKDLRPLLGKEFLSNFVSAAIDPNNQSSKILAELPRAVTHTHTMYANKALIESLGMKIPKTYAELKAMVPKLKAKGISTVLMANKDTWPMQSCLFSQISGRLLGDAYIDNVLKGKGKFTDKPFVDALNFVATLYKDGVISKDTIQIGYGESPALFAAGKAAFLIDGDWRIADFLTDKTSGQALIPPDKQKSDFAFMQFPTIPGEKNPGIVSAIVGVGFGISSTVPAGSAKEKAAVKLIKYIYSEDVMRRQGLETGLFIPTRKGVTYEKSEPFINMMMDYHGSVKKTCYVLDGVLDATVVKPLNDGLQEIGLGTKTPAEVAAEMQKTLDAYLASKK
jgi:raffinose/stachyose/melibiose transport system substrate-binding protein